MHKQSSHVNLSSSPLSPAELSAWRGFLHVHSAIFRDLDAQLREAHDLSLHEYEVLLVLSEAPGRRMRMSDVAAAVVLSQSGLTRLVDRLAEAGCVTRVRCEDDRRGLNAELSEAGLARLQEARPTHLRGVRARFLDRFSAADLATLASYWERVEPGSAR